MANAVAGQNEVGFYRGSFDPPHYGHLEVVTSAICYGMKRVFVVYKDKNRYKPFVTADFQRLEMLQMLFRGIPEVVIFDQAAGLSLLKDLVEDRSITKIHNIAGSDLFSAKQKKYSANPRIAYFLIMRKDLPVPPLVQEWNGHAITVYNPELLQHQHYSSTLIRTHFQERRQEITPLPLPPEIKTYIVQRKLYQLTDAEFAFRHTLSEVKKEVEQQIGHKRMFGADRYPFTMRLASDMGIQGLSGDQIVFIYDVATKPCLVVKVFCGGAGNIKSELKALEMIKGFQLPLVDVPELYFERASFIGMSPAPGTPLSRLMNMSPAAVRLTARACREFHLFKRQQVKELTFSQLAVFEEAIEKVLSRLKIKSEFSFDLQLLEARWQAISERFRQNPGLCSYTHGDPNPGNFIVDLARGRVAFVDLSLFTRSIAEDESPCGFAYNELIEALSSFSIVGKKQGLSAAEVEQIQKTFREEYTSSLPQDFTTPQAMVYFDSYWLLREINNLLKQYEQPQSQPKSDMHSLITEKLAHWLHD